jgi:hypothetical protein
MYFKSRTDIDIAGRPEAPMIGPAGSITVDPDFGNRIVRASDETTLMVGGKPSPFVTAGIGGSADVNTWNTDSTLLYLQDNGSQGAIFSFDPKTLAVARIYPSWRVPGVILFSRLDPNVAFLFSGTECLRYDFSDRDLPTPPPPVLVCDFAQILPAASTWKSVGGVESADRVFTCGFSTSGAQGTGVYACVFTIGKGFRMLNTQTGVVSGDYGPLGTITLPDRFTLHNVKASKDGGWMVMTITTVFSGTSKAPFFWNVDTLTVNALGSVARGGHWTAGYDEFLNNDSCPYIEFWRHVRRNLSPPSAIDQPWGLASPFPTPQAMVGLDDHLSFNGPRDSMVVSISACRGKEIAEAWWDEVLGFELNGSGKVYRFCHTFTSGVSGNFYKDNAIGMVDQQNRFVAWCSDWMQTLADGRGDTFIVELK